MIPLPLGEGRLSVLRHRQQGEGPTGARCPPVRPERLPGKPGGLSKPVLSLPKEMNESVT